MPKHVFVANYQTMDNLMADWEDNPARNCPLSDYAAPQVSRIFLKWDAKAYAAVRKDVQDELDEMFEGDEDNKPVLRWVEGEFETPQVGYENAVHFAYDEADDEDPVAAVVVQKRVIG